MFDLIYSKIVWSSDKKKKKKYIYVSFSPGKLYMFNLGSVKIIIRVFIPYLFCKYLLKYITFTQWQQEFQIYHQFNDVILSWVWN